MSDQNRFLLAMVLMAGVLFLSWQLNNDKSVPEAAMVSDGVMPATEPGDYTEPVVRDSLEKREPIDAGEFESRTVTVLVYEDDELMVTAGVSTMTGSVETWRLERYENVPGSGNGAVNLAGDEWMNLGNGFLTDAPDTLRVKNGPVILDLVSLDGNRKVRYTFQPEFYGFLLEKSGYDGITVLNGGVIPVSESNVDVGRYFRAQWNSDKVKSRKSGDIDTEDRVGNVKWIAARSKYFGIVLMPESSERAYAVVYPSEKGKSPSVGILDDRVRVYAGPLDYGVLRELGRDTHLMVDFGWPVIRDIGRLLFWFCTSVLSFVENWGLKIIILSIVLKLVLLPLTTKSFRSMAKLRQVQPRIKEIQEKYKSDPKAMQAAMQKLYKEEGVNPLGGCLPLLMQMPVFLALYRVLANSVQLRGAGFMLWITDLSTPEMIIRFPERFMGLSGIGLLPVLMGISMFLQQKMSTVDQSQKSMTYIMPIFMTYLFMRFPAGLTLYWFVNNLLTIAQQKIINDRLETGADTAERR